jgi:spore maturation protein SpmA
MSIALIPATLMSRRRGVEAWDFASVLMPTLIVSLVASCLAWRQII